MFTVSCLPAGYRPPPAMVNFSRGLHNPFCSRDCFTLFHNSQVKKSCEIIFPAIQVKIRKASRQLANTLQVHIIHMTWNFHASQFIHTQLFYVIEQQNTMRKLLLYLTKKKVATKAIICSIIYINYLIWYNHKPGFYVKGKDFSNKWKSLDFRITSNEKIHILI